MTQSRSSAHGVFYAAKSSGRAVGGRRVYVARSNARNAVVWTASGKGMQVEASAVLPQSGGLTDEELEREFRLFANDARELAEDSLHLAAESWPEY